MTKLLGFHGVEAEKAEARRRYNNRRSFSNILRAAVVVSLLCYLWFPTLEISMQIVGDWIQRTGTTIITNHFFLFLFTNILVALIFHLSSDGNGESSNTEADLYDQYTSNKQIVPAFIPEANRDVVTTDVGKRFKRTTKTKKKKKNSVTVREFRRTESARDVEEDDWGVSREEFHLNVERFIMEQKKSFLQEKDIVVQCQELTLLRASYGYSSC